ncbi:MAG: HAMP domain-containing sensor histidine kinase, partial [Bacteroidota bacterium]
QKLNNELDRFVYSASHDLRAPIASCLGLIDIAKKETDLNKIAQYLELKEKSLKRLDNFIGDILDYSRNTRLTLKSDVVNIEELIWNTFDNYSYTTQFPKIKKEVKIHAECDFVSDEHRLSVVFNNLISNAVRYYNPYISHAFIKVEINISMENCFVLIQDNGLGIDTKHLKNIFDMFYRATDRLSGSGLGLYIVKETLNKMGAEIEVSSEYGKGAAFSLKFPNLFKREISAKAVVTNSK